MNRKYIILATIKINNNKMLQPNNNNNAREKTLIDNQFVFIINFLSHYTASKSIREDAVNINKNN